MKWNKYLSLNLRGVLSHKDLLRYVWWNTAQPPEASGGQKSRIGYKPETPQDFTPTQHQLQPGIETIVWVNLITAWKPINKGRCWSTHFLKQFLWTLFVDNGGGQKSCFHEARWWQRWSPVVRFKGLWCRILPLSSKAVQSSIISSFCERIFQSVKKYRKLTTKK